MRVLLRIVKFVVAQQGMKHGMTRTSHAPLFLYSGTIARVGSMQLIPYLSHQRRFPCEVPRRRRPGRGLKAIHDMCGVCPVDFSHLACLLSFTYTRNHVLFVSFFDTWSFVHSVVDLIFFPAVHICFVSVAFLSELHLTRGPLGLSLLAGAATRPWPFYDSEPMRELIDPIQ